MTNNPYGPIIENKFQYHSYLDKILVENFILIFYLVKKFRYIN
ncbi:hypothetical protein EXM36_11200 [Clostridium botulinum]|uniref:Uncharacterized protein n=3 Tax=Clostridium TaxID=1485 RepID=A5I0P1_CLOBH|nr:hypothetical protein RSJ15_05640 [Clostridium botulinum]NEZ53264.1 hypothetical protein [Clostridium botulinum F str. Langeland]NFK37238.1 hypothetical protein [Clostridium botulinum H04402 065]PIH05984.1 hypothetical protein CS538_01300 [Clostridium combesii]CAL82602.1 hypothetical protein CBO1048 [Clostridium botulinum A str. ATCC 3502]